MSEQAHRFLEQSESDWLAGYEDGTEICITPQDIISLTTWCSGGQGPNERPEFSYDELHSIVDEPDGLFPDDHSDAITELGRWAADTSAYKEVEPEMFRWGYVLYSSIIINSEKLYRLPSYSFKRIMDSSFTSVSVYESLQALSDEAKTKVPLLWEAADDLLDGLVKVHKERGDLEDDPEQGPDNFENQRIRTERLLVVRAGIGLAYLHCLEYVLRSYSPDYEDGA